MRKTIAALAVGIAAAVIVLALEAVGQRVAGPLALSPLKTIELKTYDWRFVQTARPETARKDIALIYIDETSLRNLEPAVGRWPWPRYLHASLINFLERAPAKVIGYDINFAGPDAQASISIADLKMSGAESDQALVDAVKKAGNVIMLVDVLLNDDKLEGAALRTPNYALDVDGIYPRPTALAPFGALGDVAAGVGHNFFPRDPDAPIRHTVPFVRNRGHVIPSLGTAVALRHAGIAPEAVSLDADRVLHIADRAMPLEPTTVGTDEGLLTYLWGLIDFRGPAVSADLKGWTYPTYSAADILYSEQQLLTDEKPNVDPALFKDKMVFIGTTAAALNDVFETPFAYGKMPGINVHAAVADDILSGRFMRPAGSGERIASVVVAALVIGVAATYLPAWWATALVLVLMSAFGWVATRLFASGYWINVVQPVFASSVALFSGISYQYFVEGREKRKMKRLFGQYVSKDVYDQLVSHPELARLGGTRREMSVLFSDIRGFTTITEKGQPEEIVGMLNEYFTRMVDIVFKHHGTLDKFVGDMVMALFGAPVDDPQHAEHAVQAALEMCDELTRLNAKWATQGRFANLDIGIGINSGPMIAGNIGSEQIMSYTVIGDAVNLGSRLESLNKQYGTRIIISDATRQQLTGAYEFRPLGGVVVKGKSKPVDIYEVMSRAPEASGGIPGADISGSVRL
jgi:adenylate cyclase